MSSSNDSYVPETRDNPPKAENGSLNSNGEENLPVIQNTGTCDIHEGPSEIELASADVGKEEQGEREGALAGHHLGVIVEDEYPLWYFDTVRSMYWYYDKESRAYYLYQGQDQSFANEVCGDGISSGTTCSQAEDKGKEGIICVTLVGWVHMLVSWIENL